MAPRVLSRWLGRRPKPRTFEDQIYDAVVLESDTCYDIGANEGEMALRLAALCGRQGLVVAFEPVWPQYRRLCRRLRRAARGAAQVVPVPLGLADADRVAAIQVPAGDFGQASTAPAERWQAAHPGAELQSYECRLVTLDQFIRGSRLPPPDFAKIDVEGAELFVLRGASALLAGGAGPLMLIELFAPWQHAFGYRPWDVLSLLADFGYRVLFACPEGLVEHSPSADAPFPPQYERGYNVVAYHPLRHAARIEALAGLYVGGAANVLPTPPAPMPNRVPTGHGGGEMPSSRA